MGVQLAARVIIRGPPLSKPLPANRHCHAGNVPGATIKEITMQYMLLLFASEAGFQSITKEAAEQAMSAYGAYTEALKKAGAWVNSNRLQPVATATTVHVENGKSRVLNGPYAETKEQLGGFYLIDVPDLDAALSWAARCPGASHGTVEVRPVWTM
jgi:hypothetical protein